MIKSKLKEMDIKLVEFAERIEISRPTLNNYISLYESGEKIPNDKYQCIFDRLFKNKIKDKDVFIRRLEGCHNLIERDKALGTIDFSAEKTDLIMSIVNRIKADIKESDFDEDIYVFINLLIGSYKHEKVFKQFAEYFLYLNNIKEIDTIKEEEKPFISNCYEFMKRAVDGELKLNQEFMIKFEERISDVKKTKDEAKKNLNERIFKEKLEEQLNEMINEKVKLGLDIEEIDVEELIKNIKITEK